MEFQSPSLRGSGRFPGHPEELLQSTQLLLFQSPSLRGSGRFSPLARLLMTWQCDCFNPLHCGAVVASGIEFGPSSPWRFQSPSLRGSGRFGSRDLRVEVRPSRFNPLHCGAVVASYAGESYRVVHDRFQSPSLRGSGRFRASGRGRTSSERGVSIPFIAGQWSLRLRFADRRGRRRPVSIPFIAGQWSLLPQPRLLPIGARCFNPLHCGAVVASGGDPSPPGPRSGFQSPSLRGSGRFTRKEGTWK